MNYCIPRLQLFGGIGFGNRLFVWARCRIFSEVNDVPMLAPRWLRLAIGPCLRGGVDLSHYRTQFLLVGIMRANANEVSGFQRLWVLLRSRRISERTSTDFRFTPDTPSSHTLVMFQGLADYFGRLNGWHEFLLQELMAIAEPRYVELAASFSAARIVMNVRCANDFKTPPTAATRVTPEYKTPISWFVRSLQVIRQAVGKDVTAAVVSDGSPADLAELLQCPNVMLVRPGCAISDLLVLAHSKILLASGASSFAMWGAFLGQMPLAFIPGQASGEWQFRPACGQYFGEFDPDSPNDEFVDQCRAVL